MAGMDADLILVDSNPLENIGALREPLGVMVRGNWITRAEIDARLQLIAEKNKEP